MNESGSAFYRSVQNVLSCHLLSKNVKTKVHKSIVMSVVLYACKALKDIADVWEECVEDRMWAKKKVTKLEKIP